ncbi:MAG: hypothetical protein IPJ94_00080 [Chloroflexi bacterium]|nr:hypothetical protein [Chloroflexota bacterium]
MASSKQQVLARQHIRRVNTCRKGTNHGFNNSTFRDNGRGADAFPGGLAAVSGRPERKLAMAYNDGKAMLRTVDLARLANLRRMLEEDEHGLAAADACLLYDVWRRCA